MTNATIRKNMITHGGPLAATGSAASAAGANFPSLRAALVGAWRLVSCVETDVATGEVFLPIGEHPHGFILYTPDGYMSAQLSAAERADFASGDMYRGVPDDYVAAGIMLAGQAAVLRAAVADRKNILVAGGTSTGKTTLTNALLAEIAGTTDRVVLIEDTRELQCRAPNLVALRTKDGVASLSDLVRSSLRLRPDRIPIGEVRGAEALDLLKAWGTGHPGGIGTIHAGTALGAMRRLEQLIQEAVVTVPRALIAETIDLVAVLRGRGSERRLSELALIAGLDPATGDYRVQSAGAGGDLLPPGDPS